MAGIRIGTIFAGEVDGIKRESIKTKFFMLGLPLIPLESYYCLESTQQGERGFPISLNTKSVIIAYVRWWFGMGSILGIIMAFIIEDFILLLPSIIGLLIALSTIWIGRLPPKEKLRRQILINSIGVGAPPDLLPENLVVELGDKLENIWKVIAENSDLENWPNISSLNSIPKATLPWLFSLALYRKNNKIAEEAWKLIESDLQNPAEQAK